MLPLRRYLVNKQDVKVCTTPLHWAVSLGASAHAELLLEYGADPGIMDRLGRTVLNYCVFFDEAAYVN